MSASVLILFTSLCSVAIWILCLYRVLVSKRVFTNKDRCCASICVLSPISAKNHWFPSPLFSSSFVFPFCPVLSSVLLIFFMVVGISARTEASWEPCLFPALSPHSSPVFSPVSRESESHAKLPSIIARVDTAQYNYNLCILPQSDQLARSGI